MQAADYRWFEDFPVGEVARYGAYRLMEADLLAFAREYDPQPFHLDKAAAEASLLGGLAASGWQACAILMRLNCDGFLARSSSLGSPGLEEVRWLQPLRPGALLSVERSTLAARPSASRPTLGLVRFSFSLIADGAGPVMTQLGWLMFGRRPA